MQTVDIEKFDEWRWALAGIISYHHDIKVNYALDIIADDEELVETHWLSGLSAIDTYGKMFIL